jgi:hypothetical protein
MITAIKAKPPTVTPQIRPTQNTNDCSNQNDPTYSNTTNKTHKKLMIGLGVPVSE